MNIFNERILNGIIIEGKSKVRNGMHFNLTIYSEWEKLNIR